MTLAEQLVLAQNVVVLMFGLLLMLSALVLVQPAPEFRPKAPAVEFCQLHKMPVDKCAGMHDEG